MIRVICFPNHIFSLQLLTSRGETYYKRAYISECLSTAYRIKEGDFENAYRVAKISKKSGHVNLISLLHLFFLKPNFIHKLY
jgi:hypothetical protein